MAGLSTLATSQVNGAESLLLNKDDRKMFPIKTNEGKTPLSLWEFIPKTLRRFPGDGDLLPYLRLGYKNAVLVGYKEDAQIDNPDKVTDCRDFNLCIDVDKHRNPEYGRIVPVQFLEEKAREQLCKILDLEKRFVSFRGDLARKKLSMKLGLDLESDDFIKLIKAQIRVYPHMIMMEF